MARNERTPRCQLTRIIQPGFCRLDLDDQVPEHSTFSVNRHGRFRDSDILRRVFEAVVRACMDAGLVKGEGFAVDASVMEANASRYRGKTPDEIAWAEPEHQTRAVKEYLAGLDVDAQPNPDRKPPKVISPSDPCSAWTAKANKRVQFGYGLNYLIDIANAVIVDVEPTPARTYAKSRPPRPCWSAPSAALASSRGGLPRILLMALAVSWAGWLAAESHPTFRSAMPANVTTARYRAAIFAGIGDEAFTSARTARCCTPPVPCTRAIRSKILRTTGAVFV
jgi:hypothetical protein